MISSPFPYHTIASLRQVGMMGLTPLRFEFNRVTLFGTDTHTHTHTDDHAGSGSSATWFVDLFKLPSGR